MPRGVYTGIKCSERKHKKFIPQKHQQHVQEYFRTSPYKGLLLYHRLGSGKTCSSIITADALLKLKNITHVYVLSPGSLRQGWITEYCGVCGDNEALLKRRYTFITYNYHVTNSLPANFNNSLVIIDEVHNLINSIKNESTTAIAIYGRLIKSNCKILALSGTPIYNNIDEWYWLGNILKPRSVPANFIKLFDYAEDGTLIPKNRDRIKTMLAGIVSYFPGLGHDFYPKVIEEPIVKVVMTKEQENKYWPAYSAEEMFIRIGRPNPQLALRNPKEYETQKRMYMMSVKRILSRQPSNFYYPDLVYDKYPKRPKDALYPEGWVKNKYFNESQLIKIYSTKFAAILNNILNHYNRKHMIFTFFKDHSGVNIFKAIMDMCGIKSAVFSGSLSDSGRKKLLARFNDPKNRYGDDLKVILVTDAGAEGITLLETGHIHIVESDPRENKIQQAIGRAVRYKSHYAMPLNERVVHIWRYWSMSGYEMGEVIEIVKKTISPTGEMVNQKKKITVGPTIDQILYTEGQYKMHTINSFLQLLQNASI